MRIFEFLAEAQASLNKLHNKAQYQKALAGFDLNYGTVEEGKRHLDAYSNAVDALIQGGGTVYRAIWVLQGKKPNLKDPGHHWTLTVEAAEEYLESNAGWSAYGDFQIDNDDAVPVAYIISAAVGPNNITNKDVFIADFPEELEVTIINPRLAKIKIVKQVQVAPT